MNRVFKSSIVVAMMVLMRISLLSVEDVRAQSTKQKEVAYERNVWYAFDNTCDEFSLKGV